MKTILATLAAGLFATGAAGLESAVMDGADTVLNSDATLGLS